VAKLEYRSGVIAKWMIVKVDAKVKMDYSAPVFRHWSSRP